MNKETKTIGNEVDRLIKERAVVLVTVFFDGEDKGDENVVCMAAGGLTAMERYALYLRASQTLSEAKIVSRMDIPGGEE